jgi:hypothetical protein
MGKIETQRIEVNEDPSSLECVCVNNIVMLPFAKINNKNGYLLHAYLILLLAIFHILYFT